MHRSQGATALLGMEEFVVGAQAEVDGEVWLVVETTAGVVGCNACGSRAVGHGRRALRVRDLPAGDRPVVLVWRKRIWRCPEADCDVGTWTEETDAIPPRAVLTDRAREEICRRVGAKGHSLAQVARAFGVGWHTAMAAVVDHGRPRVDHLSRLRRPSAIGVDETSFLAANATHPTLLVSGFVDLDRHRLIDVVPGRSAVAVSTWLGAKPGPLAGGHRHRRHRSLLRLRPGPGRGAAPRHLDGGPLPRHRRAPRGAMCPGEGERPTPPGCRSSPVKLRAA